jgi:anti-sigma factor RsiW
MSRHPSPDDLAAYSIGGLDGREERAVEKHLDRCEQCADEMRERFAPAVAVLAESVEQFEPPPELRQSLMATVREEAADAGEGSDRGRAPRPARGARGFLLRPATGLAVIALLAAGVVGYVVAEGDDGQTRTVALSNTESAATGTLVVDDESATLHMKGMDPLARGDVYQVWVADPTGVKPSAAFVPGDDGTATAAVPEAAVGEVDRVMITEEPMAGRRTPSGQTVFDAQLN